MKNNFRVLLFLLTFLLIGTALTIRNSITDNDVLNLDTDNLNKNLHKKEKLVEDIFKDSILIKTFKNSERYPIQLREIANKYVDDNIFLYIYKNNKPIFWSTNLYIPESPITMADGISFIQTESFSFVLNKKKIDSEIDVLTLIPIEQNILRSNNDDKKKKFFNYLQANNLELANFNETDNIRNIYSISKNLLFSVTLKPGKYDNIYIHLQVICWLLATFLFLIVVFSSCKDLAEKGKPILSIIILGSILLLIRIFDLESGWISSHGNFNILQTSEYSYNYFSPNIWAYLLNIASIFSLIVYVINIRKHIIIPSSLKTPALSIIIYYLIICFLYFFYSYIFNQLATLITHSSTYIKSLAEFLYSHNLSNVHILIYALSIISLIIITDLILEFVDQLSLKAITTINVQLIVLIQFIIFNAIRDGFSIISVLIGLLIIIRPFDKILFQERNKSIHIITLITLALITSVKFSEANKHAQQNQMRHTISEIQAEEDIQAINKFKELEKKLFNDKQLINILQLAKSEEAEEIITSYIKKKYLTGYISQYDFKGFYFRDETPLGGYNLQILDKFREKVIGESIKVDQTNLFYKSQVTGVGVYEYFCILRLPLQNNENATLILDFTNKNSNEIFNLLTGQTSLAGNFQNTENNSYAIYRNGKLTSQKGNYIYSSKDIDLPQETNEFINYFSNDGYYHVVYRPNHQECIVVSKQEQPYWQFLAISSATFLLLYMLSFTMKIFMHIPTEYYSKEFKFKNINIQIKDLFNTIRYSTRIQTLVISSVVIVILISGLITFFSVRVQTKETREENRLKHIAEITSKLELKTLTDNSNDQIEYLKQTMQNLTNITVTDFNLYDNNGKLFYTTQPKIYEHNLLSTYINPNALIDLNIFKKIETHKIEKVLNFSYESVYAVIKNSNYNTIAYLNIPYYNSKEIDDESQNILLNTIFNIYTIIIIVFAFLSIYIANKITAPLQLIRKKLTSTNLDEKLNEPLYWEKNDEIGLLIKDYNYMLIKLEENARKLRNAERESAWREMAKQVAHEIKNPLTPMKLGIQQLSRSFRENDPKLNERFEKVTNSFIEQINALAHIANEFSAFAKLPDTNLVPLDIIEEILQSIEVFKHSKDTSIEFYNNTSTITSIVLADRDHTLRVFNNLIKNAIEANSSKKKHIIKINVNSIEQNWIKISIQDNGDGIPTELRGNIFKPNFTTKSSGTGLGLAFVKQTIDNMGGRIYFETKQFIGTTFFIELPLHQSQS